MLLHFDYPHIRGAYSQIVMAGSIAFPQFLVLAAKVMDEVIMPMGFQEIGFDVSRFPEGVYFWEYRDEIGRRETGRFEVVH